MRIAVTYENGNVFPHFGRTAQFLIVDVEKSIITQAQVVDAVGCGHGALANFLAEQKVDALICGGIGGCAQEALAAAGIRLYAGVSGDADEAAVALASGDLTYDAAPRCDHHSCESHGCGHT